MSITREAVLHVANLSRIGLTEEEIEDTRKELGDVLDFMAKLNELDTDGVPPTTHVLDISNVFRKDVAGEGMDLEELLAEAPDREDNCFRVPSILEGAGE